MNIKTIYYNDYKVTFNYDILNIHIENSYMIVGRESIANAISYIKTTEEYKELVAAGFTRSTKSLINEWLAHNIMYKWGYKKYALVLLIWIRVKAI